MRYKGNRFRVLLAAGALAAVAIAAAACGSSSSSSTPTAGAAAASGGFTAAGYKTAGFKTVTIDAGAPIKIGISSALSGDTKSLGVPIADSAETAGVGVTIKGHALQFVREDDLCTPEGGPQAADRLVKDGVIAAVGPICSGGAAASLDIYDKAGITHISPSATAGNLTSPARPEGPYVTFFRVPVLNADEAKAQADFAKNKLNAKTAFVVFDTDAYGKDLSTQFEKFFKADGGTIVGNPSGYEKKTTDFKSIITSIKAAKPDVVYLAGFYAEATPFLQQLRAESTLAKTPFLAGDGVKNDALISGAGAAAEGAYLALPGTQGSQFSTYAAAYKAKFGGDATTATFGAEAYDSSTAIIKALEKVAVDNGGKLTIDEKALNTAILQSDFAGASGQIKFNNDGNRAGGVTRFFQVKNGQYVDITGK